MNDNTANKTPDEAFVKTRDYFLGESLRPSENIPDLLAENRKIAISLAENVMSLLPAKKFPHVGASLRRNL